MTAATTSVESAKILLIEDDDGVAESVREGLESRGFTVERVGTVAAAQERLNRGGIASVVMDITLPDGSGLDLTSNLRAAGNQVPILMLTARSSVGERVEGFCRGADDYLCKPFDVEELAVRLQAIIRRTQADDRHILRYADLELDLIARTIRRHDMQTTLSAREAELLAYLMRHAEEVRPRDRILDEVWGDEADDDSNVLNVYINYLRNKVEAGRYPRLIHTIRGVGYTLSLREPDELS